MGPLSLLMAPLITAFFVVAIRLDNGDNRWSWRSGRFLSVALLLILLAKGIGDHTVATRHATGVAALQGQWLESSDGPGLSEKDRSEKVVQVLSGLGLPRKDPPLVSMLVVAGVGLNDAKVVHQLQAAVSSSGVALLAAGRPNSGPDWQGVLFPAEDPAIPRTVICGHSWLPDWVLRFALKTVCNDSAGAATPMDALPWKVVVVFPGSSLSPGWFSMRMLRDRPDAWLLIAEAAGMRSEWALRVALKHQSANALLSGRPLVGALLMRAGK